MSTYPKTDRYEPEDADDTYESFSHGGDGDKIDFDKYDDIPVEVSGRDCPKPINEWKDADLGSELHANIEEAGYKKPTPVQKNALPIVLGHRDMMGCAQTGSGKTAAFLLPILASLNKEQPWRNPQQMIIGPNNTRKLTPYALVLAPTRELAVQIHDEARKFSRGTRIKCAILFGGDPIGRQLRGLERGCDVIVATPGRLGDVLDRGKLSLSQIRFLVLDEADRMLDMGFEPQIRRIVEQEDMPKTGKRQTLMFSATFAKEIQQLAASFLYDYVFVTIGRVGSTTELITQRFLQVTDEQDKNNQLEALLRDVKGLTLIFVETKKKASNLDWSLRKKGYPACSIHGDREQHERMAALRDFSSGKTPILIATNVAARGLDISNIAHVINYEMPSNIDDYVHRIGRTGRAGKTGISTSFIGPENSNIVVPLIERLHESGIEVPSWLEAMRPYRGRGGSNNRGGYRGGRGGGRGGNKFGGRDFRYNSSSSYPSSAPSSTSSGYAFAPPPNAYQQAQQSYSYSNGQSYGQQPYQNGNSYYQSQNPYQVPTNGTSTSTPSSYSSSSSYHDDRGYDRKRKPEYESSDRDKSRRTSEGRSYEEKPSDRDRYHDRKYDDKYKSSSSSYHSSSSSSRSDRY